LLVKKIGLRKIELEGIFFDHSREFEQKKKSLISCPYFLLVCITIMHIAHSFTVYRPSKFKFLSGEESRKIVKKSRISNFSKISFVKMSKLKSRFGLSQHQKRIS